MIRNLVLASALAAAIAAPHVHAATQLGSADLPGVARAAGTVTYPKSAPVEKIRTLAAVPRESVTQATIPLAAVASTYSYGVDSLPAGLRYVALSWAGAFALLGLALLNGLPRRAAAAMKVAFGGAYPAEVAGA